MKRRRPRSTAILRLWLVLAVAITCVVTVLLTTEADRKSASIDRTVPATTNGFGQPALGPQQEP